MRNLILLAICVPFVAGCRGDRFVVKTQVGGAVETRLDMPPVSVSAGHVKPVVVQPGQTRIAVLDVDGLILNTPFVGPLSAGENPVGVFREKLEAIACDKCVKGVVLRINSHGGGVAACITMRYDLECFKQRTGLPIVACLMDTAAGGAYYLASAADYIVAGPATITGGVGVVLNLYNLRDLMGLASVLPQMVKAGDFTDIGTSARAVTEEEKKLLQAMADEFHRQLIADIKMSRPTATAATTFDGRIFTGSQAVTRGLVDEIGTLDHAICKASELGCGTTGCRPGVVMYRRANDPARSIYAITPNVPLQGAGLFPSVPGIDRTKMPTFLSAWQPELTMERLGGK